MFPLLCSAGPNPLRIQSMLQSLPAPPPPPGMQINPAAAAQPALPPPSGAAGQAKKTCPFCLQQLSWHALSRHIRDMHKGDTSNHQCVFEFYSMFFLFCFVFVTFKINFYESLTHNWLVPYAENIQGDCGGLTPDFHYPGALSVCPFAMPSLCTYLP